jgi:ribosomal protein S18 acetylase RimI-like enzyme
MQDLVAYRKFATLSNGKEVLIRLINGHDRLALTKFFHQVPIDDVQFCKQDVKSPQVVDAWLHPENCHRTLGLVALDIPTNRIIASLNIMRGQQAALMVGDIQQIIVARPFQGLGLGSLILDALIDLAAKENLHWLKVEIVTELKTIIKAFQSKGFKIRTILDDYFIDLKGITYDVALMLRPLIKNDEEDF